MCVSIFSIYIYVYTYIDICLWVVIWLAARRHQRVRCWLAMAVGLRPFPGELKRGLADGGR